VRLEGLGKMKKFTSSGTRTGDLPACSIVPQPATLPLALLFITLSGILQMSVPDKTNHQKRFVPSFSLKL
jgi:hypothetical protein